MPLIRPGLFAGLTLVLISSFTELGTPLMFSYYTITPVQLFHQITDVADNPLPYAGLATTLSTEYDYAPHIEGQLPAALQGTLYRNGPGRFDRGGLRKRMLLDGDGMLQAYQFRNGRVRFRTRFVRTTKYVAEEAAGRFLSRTWSTHAG